MRGDEIRVRVRVCGPRGCETVTGIVDTGATKTVVSEALAKRLGLKYRGKTTAMTAAGVVGTSIFDVEALCASRCLCTRGTLHTARKKSHLGGDVLLGMDYLRAVGASIDAGKLRWTCRKKR